MSHITNSTIKRINTTLDIALTQEQVAQFSTYAEMLLAWNQRLNLTAVRTSHGVEKIHFVDSLSVILVTGSLSGKRLIDVGSGAGFPGIPLKIVFPDLVLTLVESVQKKAAFMNEVVKTLGLEGVTVLDERAETLAKDAVHREQYDWALARAVAELGVLIEYLAPFCKVNGRLLAMKGPDYSRELEAGQTAIEKLNVTHEQTYTVPAQLTEDRERYLLVFKKMGKTPLTFPRRPGMATKRPL